MLTPGERTRFNLLRDRRDGGEPLTKAETEEVEAMVRRIEADEAAYLAPASERIRQEGARLAQRFEALQALVGREEQFVARLDQVLEELRAERENLVRERERLLTAAV